MYHTYCNWETIPAVLDVADLCKILKMTKPTVLQLLQNREIPARKVGKLWRIDKDNLKKYLGGN